jgi:hypothetical protein
VIFPIVILPSIFLPAVFCPSPRMDGGAQMRRGLPLFSVEIDLTAKLRRNIINVNESESQ